MHPYPHHYAVTATGPAAAGEPVVVTAPGLPPLATTSPPQFDGPEGHWSPETLLCAAVADCFILTFRAVSRIAGLPWLQLECGVTGTLEKVERQSRFTAFTTSARLTVPPGTSEAAARRLLEQAEHGCLVANSLLGTRTLVAEIVVATG